MRKKSKFLLAEYHPVVQIISNKKGFTTMENKYQKAIPTKRGLKVFPQLKGKTIEVEGTTETVMGIKDPFKDPRGLTNPACCALMMALVKDMSDYAGETCFYCKVNSAGMVLTQSMFEIQSEEKIEK